MATLQMLFRAEQIAARCMGIKSRKIKADWGSLHLYEAKGLGDGPPILVQHGVGAHAGQFVAVLRRLRKYSRRVIAPDLPGHGLSDAIHGLMSPKELFARVAPLFDEILTEPTVLVGNSMGGATVLRYSINHPEKVLGLVLAAPGGSPMSETRLQQLMDTFRIRTVKQGREFACKLVAKPNFIVNNSLVGYVIKKTFNAPAMRQFVDSIAPDDLFTPEEIEKISSFPILLLWGDSDRILPTETRDFFREHLPAASMTYEPMLNCGHSPHFDNPKGFVKFITDFAEHVRRDKPASA